MFAPTHLPIDSPVFLLEGGNRQPNPPLRKELFRRGFKTPFAIQENKWF
jgi:hypothetical protein